jgi:hypothetical protein
LPKTAFTIVRGELTHFFTDSNAGGEHKRGFCATCGARVSGGETDEAIGITASSLDDPSVFTPQLHMNIADAQPWDHIPEGAPTFAGYPT